MATGRVIAAGFSAAAQFSKCMNQYWIRELFREKVTGDLIDILR